MTTEDTDGQPKSPSELSFEFFRKAIEGDADFTETLKAAVSKDSKSDLASTLAATKAELEGEGK